MKTFNHGTIDSYINVHKTGIGYGIISGRCPNCKWTNYFYPNEHHFSARAIHCHKCNEEFTIPPEVFK